MNNFIINQLTTNTWETIAILILLLEIIFVILIRTMKSDREDNGLIWITTLKLISLTILIVLCLLSTVLFNIEFWKSILEFLIAAIVAILIVGGVAGFFAINYWLWKLFGKKETEEEYKERLQKTREEVKKIFGKELTIGDELILKKGYVRDRGKHHVGDKCKIYEISLDDKRVYAYGIKSKNEDYGVEGYKFHMHKKELSNWKRSLKKVKGGKK